MNQRFADHLERLADTLPRAVPPTDELVRHGRRSKRSRAAGAATGLIVLTIAGIVAAPQLFRDDKPAKADPATVAPCPTIASYDQLQSMPTDLPRGAESIRLCPTFFWPLDRPQASVTEDVDRIIDLVNKKVNAPVRFGDADIVCTTERRPIYLLAFNYPDGSVRAVHAAPSPVDDRCDFVWVGAHRTRSGGNEVIRQFDKLARRGD
jgi:hypothetical protein